MREIILTQKQKETLDFIKSFISKTGEAPTITKLCEGLKLKSLRSVTQRLEALEAKGFIKRNPFKHRGITLLDSLGSSGTPVGTERIPVIGSAGCDMMQIYAQETYDEFLVVDKKLLDPQKEIIAVKAIGDSMLGANIRSGDYVLVEVTGDIHNGDRILVILGDMAVIKRFKQTSNIIVLEPESKDRNYSPIIMKEGFNKILGKVLRVIQMNQRNDDIEYIYEKNSKFPNY